MSEDDSLGTVCGINRRTYVLIIALGFLLYGVYNALYFVIYSYVFMFKLTPTHCSGPGCTDVMTCAASREASYHVRLSIMAIGSLVFGIHAVNAVYNKYASDMFNFACWLLAVGIVYFVVGLLDGSYMVLCGNVYSYNVIMETVLWPITGLPLNSGIKYEIRQLTSYPVGYVNALCFHNIAFWYGVWTFVRVSFFGFCAFQAFVLAQRFHYGMAGMGATFSIEGWRKRLMMRYEINEVVYNTFDMAGATGMDVGWTEDEFKLQRPLRQPHWYRGMMPAAAARAYDGFRDDRRNVLL